MKLLIIQNLLSSNSIYRKSFFKILTSTLFGFFLMFMIVFYNYNKTQEVENEEKRMAIQKIIVNSLESSAKYGDLIYSRASSLQLGKSLDLLDLGICDNDKDIFERVEEPRCKNLKTENAVFTRVPSMLNGQQYILEFKWNRILVPITKQLALSLLVSLGLVLLLIFPIQIFLLNYVLRKVQKSVGQLIDEQINTDSFEAMNDTKNSEKMPIEFIALAEFISNKTKELKLATQDKIITDIAKQVSHDIRSPLASLKMALEDVESIPSEYRDTINLSVKRINDIASDLLNKGNNTFVKIESSAKTESIYLPTIIENIAKEKKLQFKYNKNITINIELKNTNDAFAKINSADFCRIISNLINNSVEAMVNGGIISIEVIGSENDFVSVIVSDTGHGIPKYVLDKLGERGVSYGKVGSESGSGLGIYHAKKTIELYDGTFKIESTEGAGTRIELTLPKFKQNSLTDFEFYEYVYLDDDKLMRMAWEKRAKKKNIKLLTLKSISEFNNHINLINKEITKIYFDSDLGEDEMRGEGFAKLLHEKGFKHLYIASGHESHIFAHLTWLKYAGKECPF